MKLFPLYVLMSAMVVASPGPGVVMTLTNALRYGVKNAFPGILGLAAGIVFIAGISSTGLGVLLATSPVAFAILKYIGAAYLIYLGVRSWIAAPFHFVQVQSHAANFRKRFWESFTLQFTNPKALFFCLGVFPFFCVPVGEVGSSGFVRGHNRDQTGEVNAYHPRIFHVIFSCPGMGPVQPKREFPLEYCSPLLKHLPRHQVKKHSSRHHQPESQHGGFGQ